MTRRRGPHALGKAFILAAWLVAFAALSALFGSAAHAAGPDGQAATKATTILGLGPADRKPTDPPLSLGIGDTLLVRLDGTEVLNPADWKLFLNGHEVPDLANSAAFDDASHGLLFKLARTDKNKAVWNEILGSPDGLRDVSVSVARTDQKDAPRLEPAEKGKPALFELNTLPLWPLLWAAVVAASMLVVFFWAAIKTGLLRDSFLPQLPVRFRTFSLGRCQMAFWFLLVAVSFVFLCFLLWDYNTLNAQALTLMGISAATGLGAIVANTSRTDVVAKISSDLTAAGFVSADDYDQTLAQLRADEAMLAKLKAESAPTAQTDPVDAQIKANKTKIEDFRRLAKDYLSETLDPEGGKFKWRGILNDIIDDGSGATLHRLQLVCWTAILGAVFVVGIYRDLTMPEFSGTLLALMAVTGGAYVGFKFPEKP